MKVIDWLLVWALVVAQCLIILMYAAQLFIIRHLMKKHYNFFWLKVRCNMWFFFTAMIVGMIIREVIYILVYPYNGQDHEHLIVSVVEKSLLYITEIVPSVLLCISAMQLMLVDS